MVLSKCPMIEFLAFPPASVKILMISNGDSGVRPGWKLTGAPVASWPAALACIDFFSKAELEIKLSYRKVTSSRLSWLVAHFHIFRLLMKGNFDAYVLWPLDKMVQNWIVDWSTARDFMVSEIVLGYLIIYLSIWYFMSHKMQIFAYFQY